MRIRFGLSRYLLASLFLANISEVATATPSDQPELSALEPSSGITTPGTRVTAYGKGFSQNTTVYFGGLEVRETRFINTNTLEVVTPYLRPGVYKLQLKTVEAEVQSNVTFTALPAPIDKELDQALGLPKVGRVSQAIEFLRNVASIDKDYQVRAYAHYEASEIASIFR